MKEIIEKAEKLGYKPLFNNHLKHSNGSYIELCLIQKWIYRKFGIWIETIKVEGFCYGLPNTPYRGTFYELIEALEAGVKKALEILEQETNR